MNEYINDTQDYVCSITPKEFEEFCMVVLNEYVERMGYTGFVVRHIFKIKTHDGIYQIDVYAEFPLMGAKIKILCECKRHKNE